MIKNDFTDALRLWGIGHAVAMAMGVEFAIRYAENGFTAPFTREWFLRGVEDMSRPTPEEFHD
jgi:hypothetical protein